MLLASQDKRSMNSRVISDSDRQNLLDRLLDAVKQCQVRFGGKTELATDADSRVTCMLAQLSAIFGHGLKKPKGTIRAFMQVGQVAGITKQQELEPDFYTFIKEHLSKNEIERFDGLHHINNDAGRGRAWLRSTLNEHTLEKTIHNILGHKQLLRTYYEPFAFLLDEEKASMLPMIAAGLSSILFALGIDKEELNAVKHVSSQLPSTKEVFSNLLSSFPAAKPKEEDPAAILAETTSNKEIRKKKKKKKTAAIVSIDDIDNSQEDLYTENQENNYSTSNSTQYSQKQSNKTQKQGHSRSSSYPGKIKLEISDNSEATLTNSRGFSREISLSDDSITKWTDTSAEDLYEKAVSQGFSKSPSYGQSVDTIEEKDEKHTENLSGDNITEGTNNQINNISKLSSDIEFHDKSTEVLENEQPSDDKSNPHKPDSRQEKSFFSVKSFKSSFKSRKSRNSDTYDNDVTSSFDNSDLNQEDILSSSLAKESSDSLLLMGGDDGLLPIMEKPTEESNEFNLSEKQVNLDGEEDKSSSKDSISLSSNSWFDDADDKDDLLRARSDSLSAATDAAAAALELCSSTSHVDPLTSVSANVRTSNQNDDVKSQEETMSTGELKQAIVSMMLRKDEMEEKNRLLHQSLEERQQEKEVLQAQMEQMVEDSNKKEEQNSAQIKALTRENEVLKHQLKKYVGAVQMLRNSINDPSSLNSQALSGIRQEEVLPNLPKQQVEEDIDSANEAQEYKQKLIQVAEMHGELMEFNEHLQIQSHYWQTQALRMQEELINLRGPLPEDCQARERTDTRDQLAVSVRSRPLINVWIPSVFLKGKGSAGVHHLYQVYIRITDDEWNVYRRYSQFLDLHRKFYKKHKIVETYKFPSKKTFGNRGTKFVEERRKALQEYIRQVVNLMISTEPEFTSNTCKATLLDVMPFFGDPYPPKGGKRTSAKRKLTQPYDGL